MHITNSGGYGALLQSGLAGPRLKGKGIWLPLGPIPNPGWGVVLHRWGLCSSWLCCLRGHVRETPPMTCCIVWQELR